MVVFLDLRLGRFSRNSAPHRRAYRACRAPASSERSTVRIRQYLHDRKIFRGSFNSRARRPLRAHLDGFGETRIRESICAYPLGNPCGALRAFTLRTLHSRHLVFALLRFTPAPKAVHGTRFALFRRLVVFLHLASLGFCAVRADASWERWCLHRALLRYHDLFRPSLPHAAMGAPFGAATADESAEC